MAVREFAQRERTLSSHGSKTGENTGAPQFLLAFDTDWVPQFVLDNVLEQLAVSQVHATFFCTSPYDFTATPEHELALHPNFLPGSTHGDSPEACLAHLKALYPLATGSRSHALYWHSYLLQPVLKAGIAYEASTFCPLQSHLRPWVFCDLWRIPVWWSDCMHILNGCGLNAFSLPRQYEPGLKVCVFHPIHIYLNTRDLSETRAALSAVLLPEATAAELAPLRRGGQGIARVFEDYLRLNNTDAGTLSALLPTADRAECAADDQGDCHD